MIKGLPQHNPHLGHTRLGYTLYSVVTGMALPLVFMSENVQLLIKISPQQFENTSTSVAASQMRNALNQLADTVTDASEKEVRRTIHIF